MCRNSGFSLPCSRLIPIMVNIYSTNKSAREICKQFNSTTSLCILMHTCPNISGFFNVHYKDIQFSVYTDIYTTHIFKKQNNLLSLLKIYVRTDYLRNIFKKVLSSFQLNVLIMQNINKNRDTYEYI